MSCTRLCDTYILLVHPERLWDYRSEKCWSELVIHSG